MGGGVADRGDDEVRRLARELLPRAMSVSARITERVLQAVPEMAPAGAPNAVHLVQESTDQNIGAMLSTLAFGVTATSIEPPAGTQDLVDNLTAAGGNVTHLLRSYRVGHQLLWQLWSEHVHAEIRDPADLPEVLRISSAHLFDFIDRACQRIVESTPLPGATVSGGGDKQELVRRLLGSDPVDLGSATATLGYDLARHHVALYLMPLHDASDPRRELDSLIAAAGSQAFTVPAGDGSWWAWLGFAVTPDDGRLGRITEVAVTGVLAGMGEPGRGRDGFRRSLSQARDAVRVGRLAREPRPGVLRHRDVEVAAMLCGDPERAREFADVQLGALAARDDTGDRLRATVRALLANGHNRAQAADALHVHHKTVAYRINQVEELLGRPITRDTLALETALLIDLTLHGP
jgi:DNA-binding PucR family transcriptional regulator